MNILLTNDDGYFADGLITLAKTLKNAGYNVYISAPQQEQSATSHALILRYSFGIQNINLSELSNGELDVPCIAVGGFPSDCVKFAISEYFKDIHFDLCISGINTCMNVGTDCIYSGTYSAACEASLLGVPGIALSAKMKDSKDYSYPARFLVERLEQLIKYCKKFSVLNINMPSYKEEDIKGVVATKTGWREYNDNYVYDKETKKYHVLGKPINKANTDQDDDCAWVDRGYISIVPIPAYFSDMGLLAKMKEDKWN